jgi:site-specific DNA-methyltransferase (adenine-specific)/modification methylase
MKDLKDYLFYQDDWATIYCGDCRDILPMLEPVDLVLTDPPYGINYSPKYGRRKMPDGSWLDPVEMPCVIGDKIEFDPTPVLNFPLVILWGANHYCHRLPFDGRWLIWDKRCSVIPERNQSDCEIAWMNKYGAARIFRHMWDGMVRDSERDIPRVHPTQKPEALMRWCIGFAPDAKTILDPFMGSGTTLVAAKNLNRKSIGIEIEPKYCEIAVKRLRQEVFDFRIET